MNWMKGEKRSQSLLCLLSSCQSCSSCLVFCASGFGLLCLWLQKMDPRIRKDDARAWGLDVKSAFSALPLTIPLIVLILSRLLPLFVFFPFSFRSQEKRDPRVRKDDALWAPLLRTERSRFVSPVIAAAIREQ